MSISTVTPIKLDAFIISDKGLIRKTNQDAWGQLPNEQLYMIADGMGGHRAGDVAAWELVHTLAKYLPPMMLSLKYQTICPYDVLEKILGVISVANERLYRMGAADPDLLGMGTTLCMMIPLSKWIFFGHVGDSRIYSYSSQEGMSQLTEDQVVLIEKPPRSGRKVRVLRQAVGISHQIKPKLDFCSVSPGDLYMMCTDGLTDFVKDEVIEEILSLNLSLSDRATHLVELAKNNGGRDNITVALVSVKRCH